MTEFSRKIQLYTAFITYFLSGFFIFHPLFDSDNTAISFIISTVLSVVIFEIEMFFFFHKSKNKLKCGSATNILLSTLCALLCVFCSLILITQVIGDISYSTGRYISTSYYIFCSIILLFISFYLCIGKERGIFRFCSVCALAYLIFIPVCYFCFLSTSATFTSFPEKCAFGLQIKSGIFSAIMLSCDICVFLYAFSDFLRQTDKAKKHLRISFFICHCLVFAFCLCALLAFGQKLTFDIANVPFSIVKLIPGIDLSEFLSALRIISFTVKSSLYVYSTSQSIKQIFKSSKRVFFFSSLFQYLLIPTIFLTFLLLFENAPYGAVQQYIFPLTLLFSALALINKYFY